MYNAGNSRLGKTGAAQDWTLNAFYALSAHEAQFKIMREAFDPLLNYYSVRLIAYYPEAQFVAKGKGISQRTHDLSNFEKPLIDLMFLPRHCDFNAPYGFQNLCIDDKYVGELYSCKRATSEAAPYIIVEIKIGLLSSLVDQQ